MIILIRLDQFKIGVVFFNVCENVRAFDYVFFIENTRLVMK